MEKLPNLIIAGVHKAATTSLYTYLSWHPDVFGSGKKEIHYFTPLRFGGEVKPISEYEKYFQKRKDEKYAIDASPSYVYGGERIIHQMQTILPPHRIIVVLRNPVDRFISNYNYLRAKLLIEPEEDLNTFIKKCITESGKPLIDDDYSRAIMEGRYIDFIPGWIDTYGENFKILYFEELVSNPAEVMVELARWLGISEEEFKDFEYTVENKTMRVKSKRLHAIALFVNHNLEVFFRNNHKLKVRLRSIYYGLNKRSKDKENLNKANIDFIESLYKESNDKLLQYLKARGLKTPNWL